MFENKETTDSKLYVLWLNNNNNNNTTQPTSKKQNYHNKRVTGAKVQRSDDHH